MNFDLPPLMVGTPGMTRKKFSRDPLATEEEATPGPDDWNPFDEEADRREIARMGFDPDDVLETPTKRANDPLADLL